MDKYDCKKCTHSGKGSVFKRNKKCERCWIDTKNLKGKPSNFERKEIDFERKEIYTCYSPENDITFIMEDTYKNNERISTEVKGFYYGESSTEATKKFYGDLKAEF